MSIRTVAITALAVLLITALPGCGSGDGPPSPVVARLVVQWAARSRDVAAPSSALSAAVTLKTARPDGSDVVFHLNRDGAPAAYVQTVATDVPILPGPYDLNARFFAEPNEAGAVVGIAEGRVTVEPDGSIPTPIVTVGRIDRVLVYPPVLYAGEKGTPLFNALDDKGGIIAVSPGSVFYAITNGQEHARITSDGLVEGISRGSATMTATVDGKVSPPSDFKVLFGGLYTILQLAPPYERNDPFSAVLGMNRNGEMCGYRHYWTKDSIGYWIACYWSATGALTEFPVPFVGRPQDLNYGASSAAYAINGSGLVVGNYLTDDNGTAPAHNVAFAGSNGALTPLPSLGGSNSTANGLNDAGQIVGWSQTAGGETHAALWSGGSVQDLGPGVAYCINTAGRIAGVKNNQTVIWDSPTALPRVIVTAASRPHQVNRSGTVVGEVRGVDGKDHAFYWNGGANVTDLGPGKAFGINSRGEIVGTSEGRAVLWRAGQKIDLTGLVPEPEDPVIGPLWELTEAHAINDNGQIAGIGVIRGQEGQGASFVGFRITPR